MEQIRAGILCIGLASVAVSQSFAPDEDALVVDVSLTRRGLADKPADAGAEQGLAALWHVPGVAATVEAVATELLLHDLESYPGRFPYSVLPQACELLPSAQLDRATLTLNLDRTLASTLLLECDTATAAAVYEGVLASLRERAIETRSEDGWTDARGVEILGPKRRTWVAHSDRQLALADGAPPSRGQRSPAVTGLHVRGRIGQAMLGPSLALIGEIFVLPEMTGMRAAMDLDIDGYCASLVIEHERPAAGRKGRAPGSAPVVPRLDDMLLVARTDLSPTAVRETCDRLREHLHPSMSADLIAAVTAQLAGPLAVGVAAPLPGGLWPRVVVGARLRDDADPMRAIRVAAEEAGVQVSQRDVDDAAITWLEVDGLPAALRPSFCVVADELWMAESVLTMRALVRELGEREDVFADAAATPCVVPDGAVTLAEFWFDSGAIWRAMSAVAGALPMQAALMPVRPFPSAPQLLDYDDLPDPDEVAETLGCGRAVLFAADEALTLQTVAPALGPLPAAGLALGTAMLPGPLAHVFERMRMDTAVLATQARAERLGAALRQWRGEHGDRLPATLDQLLPLLPANDPAPLLAPHGPRVRDENGAHSRTRWSWQLAPQGMTAAPDLPTIPGSRAANATRFDPGPERPVFAFCAYGYRDHHLLLLADGDIAWARSTRLLRALPTGR